MRIESDPARKLQTPNTKFQRSNKFQAPTETCVDSWSVGTWRLEFLWRLELDVWSFFHLTIANVRCRIKFAACNIVSSAAPAFVSPSSASAPGNSEVNGDAITHKPKPTRSSTKAPTWGSI